MTEIPGTPVGTCPGWPLPGPGPALPELLPHLSGSSDGPLAREESHRTADRHYSSLGKAARSKLAAKGHALPGGAYPIPDKAHLHSAAVLAASHHGDWQAARKLIAKRAAELGVPLHSLPGFTEDDEKAQPHNRHHHDDSHVQASASTYDGFVRLDEWAADTHRDILAAAHEEARYDLRSRQLPPEPTVSEADLAATEVQRICLSHAGLKSNAGGMMFDPTKMVSLPRTPVTLAPQIRSRYLGEDTAYEDSLRLSDAPELDPYAEAEVARLTGGVASENEALSLTAGAEVEVEVARILGQHAELRDSSGRLMLAAQQGQYVPTAMDTTEPNDLDGDADDGFAYRTSGEADDYLTRLMLDNLAYFAKPVPDSSGNASIAPKSPQQRRRERIASRPGYSDPYEGQ